MDLTIHALSRSGVGGNDLDGFTELEMICKPKCYI